MSLCEETRRGVGSYYERWNAIWNQALVRGAVPPWDVGRPCPEVIRLLDSGDLLRLGLHSEYTSVLIPGAGSGYDAIGFAKRGFRVTAIDIAEVAVLRCKSLVEAGATGVVSVIQEDFFLHNPDDGYDLIVDYCFACSLAPGSRSVWARQMFSLLKPGSGILIMIFPAEPYMIGETNSKRGAPPYQVPVGSIRAIAQQLDLKILKLERVEPKFSFRARQGLEWVCILQRHQRL